MKIINLYDGGDYTISHNQQAAVDDMGKQRKQGKAYLSSLVQKRDSAEYMEINFDPKRVG